MPDYTDPTTAAAQVAPGELGLAADWNTYALNNVEAATTAQADTIDDLEDHWGGAIIAQRSGRFGTVRVGASPFDLLTVTWDDTVSRWVSPTYSFGSSGDKGSESAAGANQNWVLRRTSASGTNEYWGPLIQWQTFVDAGFIPQFRWLWVVSIASTTWSVYRLIQGVDMGGTFATGGAGVGSLATGTQTSPTLQGDAETAWVTNPLGTVTDYICPGINLGTSSAAAAQLWQVTFLWRWVSA